MYFKNLKVTNFGCLADIELYFDGEAPGHVITGINEAGKSFLADSIKFCLTADPVRVSRKNELEHLVRWGMDRGRVSIEADDGVHSRDIASGQGTPPVNNPYLKYCLDPHWLARETPDQRKAMLYELLGLEMNVDEWRKDLKTWGVTEGVIEELLPMTRGGFEAAHDAAKRKLTGLRSMWKGITKENYGSIKAETWEPKSDLHDDAMPMDELGALIEDKKKTQAEIEEQISTKVSELQIVKKLGATHTCPSCDAKLRFVDGKLESTRKRKLPNTDAIANDVDKLQAQKRALADEVSTLLLQVARRQIDTGEAARAHAIHKDILAWTEAEKATDPNGIPHGKIQKRISVFNDRLVQTKELTGKRLVQLNTKLGIDIDGKPYGVHSVSAKWWADAALADAIANISETRILVLDGFDVLSPKARGQCLLWLHKLNRVSDYDTILLLGTTEHGMSEGEVPPTFVHHRIKEGAFVDG